MRIKQGKKLEEFKRIENLLYGINYEVWLNLYGPIDSSIGLLDSLHQLISEDCEITDGVMLSPEKVMSEIMEMILYEDGSCGPLELESKKSEIIGLMDKVFSFIDIKNADVVSEFRFEEGHPAYPVFWDFAYEIISNDQRWILVGSSSD